MAVSDPMLLTLPPPAAKSEFEFRVPHDFVHPPSPRRTLSPKAEREPLRPLPVGTPETMTAPHRGLPPPSAMSLPDPGRIAPPMAPAQFTGLPAPPSQWQGAEDSMRSWLVTKAEEEKRRQEEEKRRQEEEKTRQESLRLEQRKIEQTMLQESFRNGIPPPLIPMIFAGIGGGNLASVSLEWLQQYAAQFQLAQQPQLASQAQSQGSPDARRDSRLIGQSQPPPYPGAPQGVQALPTAPTLQGQPSAQPHYPPVAMSPSTASRQVSGTPGGPTSAPRPPLPNVLPRLTTNEMQIQTTGAAQVGGQAGAQGPPEQPPSSPAIYFHHWVPPASQSGSGNPPATPSDYTNSPKKRKAQGAHQPAPQPSSAGGHHTSPSFSQISSSASTPGRRPVHGRTRSDASARGGAPTSDRPTTSSSQADSSGRPEPESLQRQRTRPHAQQHSRGGSIRDDRSESGSHSSQDTSIRRSGGHMASPERGSAPVSPKPEGAATAENSRSSFGFGPAGRPP